MDSLNVIRLKLYAPIFYQLDEGIFPFECSDLREDVLFSFEIADSQYKSIEPDIDCYLSDILFKGRLSALPSDFDLSAGDYLFAQKRGIMSKKEILLMALEVQKDGLWEKLILGNQIYFRYLFEDGNQVAQVFRPICQRPPADFNAFHTPCNG